MNKTLRRHDRLRAAAEAHFRMPVREITAPGGSSRASIRLHFEDKTVIASHRPNFRRTHLEAFILQRLQPHCDDLPICYGVAGDIMFQSDVGARRLNQEIHAHGRVEQLSLAEEAVQAIFRIHAAARRTDLHEKLPHLGNNPDWLRNFVDGVDVFTPLLETGVPESYPREALADYLDQPKRQFVKWDCRSGNAALDEDDRLRWFDFEYAGLRHGAEDLAWLLGDESWPLDGQAMLEIVEEAFDPDCGHDFDDYLAYLAIYTTLHCVQRLTLILREVQRRGWRAQETIVERDDVGRHPVFAAHLCRVGAFFAERQPATAMLIPCFEAAEARFAQIRPGV